MCGRERLTYLKVRHIFFTVITTHNHRIKQKQKIECGRPVFLYRYRYFERNTVILSFSPFVRIVKKKKKRIYQERRRTKRKHHTARYQSAHSHLLWCCRAVSVAESVSELVSRRELSFSDWVICLVHVGVLAFTYAARLCISQS